MSNKMKLRLSLRNLFLLTAFVAIFSFGYSLGVKHERSRNTDSLSQLISSIQSTINPNQWMSNGGTSTILSYPSNISVTLAAPSDSSAPSDNVEPEYVGSLDVETQISSGTDPFGADPFAPNKSSD